MIGWPNGHWGRSLPCLLFVAGLGLGSLPAGAQSAPAVAVGWQLATGLGAGAVRPDQELADYRWDTRPAGLYSLQAIASRGRVGLGLRFSRWATTQGTGLDLPGGDPLVRLNTVEVLAHYRAVEIGGVQLWGTALVGRTGIAYAPDRITIPTGGTDAETTVDFAAQDELSLGLGWLVQKKLGNRLSAALQSEWSGFQLDASHRRGQEIVSGRERFVNWSLRLQVSWIMDLG